MKVTMYDLYRVVVALQSEMSMYNETSMRELEIDLSVKESDPGNGTIVSTLALKANIHHKIDSNTWHSPDIEYTVELFDKCEGIEPQFKKVETKQLKTKK